MLNSLLKIRPGVQLITAQNRALVNNSTLQYSKRYLSMKFLDKYKLPKQNPGAVEGTINDKLKTPDLNFFEGGFHWGYEKIIALAIIPTSLLPFYSYLYLGNLSISPIWDSLLSIFLLMHASYGYKSCIIDYIPERKFGYWHKFCKRLLQLGGVLSLYGIYVMETENNGMTDLVRRLWRAKSSNDDDEAKNYI